MTKAKPGKVWVDGHLKKVKGQKKRVRVKGHYRKK